MKNRTVVLLSGGLDSAVTLYLAKQQGLDCRCLAFEYGQRHMREIASARAIARQAESPLQVIKIALPWRGSSLLDRKEKIHALTSLRVNKLETAIPNTYVPGRNIIFLSFALSYAEAIGASEIFIGAHAQDYSGYPDCRLPFYQAFKKAAKLGTKAGVENRGISIKTPLINKNKAQIIRIGHRLAVPFKLTWSCYSGLRYPCGKCDSCYFRAKGFSEAGIKDPSL